MLPVSCLLETQRPSQGYTVVYDSVMINENHIRISISRRALKKYAINFFEGCTLDATCCATALCEASNGRFRDNENRVKDLNTNFLLK